MTGARAASFFLCLAALFAASPANAALKLCNRTSYILYAATGQASGADMVTQGWTKILPGACEIAVKGPLRAPSTFFYAQTSRAHSGISRAWGGSTTLCARHGNFTFRAPMLTRGCGQSDAFEVPYGEIVTGRQKDRTRSFTEKPQIATLEQARIAGMQRLLSDNGLRPGKIDGKKGKQLDRALAAFRKKEKLAENVSDAALFQSLETAAARVTAPAGLSLCNSTRTPLWAAIGIKNGATYQSRGWWKVPPMHCTTAISEPLRAERVYLLADLPGKKPLVTGTAKFCVTDIAFEIEGRKDCKGRGLREMGFAETKAGGRKGLVAHFGPKGLTVNVAR